PKHVDDRMTRPRFSSQTAGDPVTDVVNPTSAESTEVNGAQTGPTGQTRTGMSADALRHAVSLAVRDRMQKRWMATTQDWLDLSAKVTCYLSAEFLMGPQLGNNLLNL